MKRITALFIVLLTVFAAGCAALSPEISESERQAVADSMGSHGIRSSDMRFEVVYDVKDSPRYILCVSSAGYTVYDRVKKQPMEICEDPGDPYEGFAEAKKYYLGVSTFGIYDESSPEAPYYNIFTGRHSDSLNDLPNWKGPDA